MQNRKINSRWRGFLRIAMIVIISLFTLLAAVFYALTLPKVQQFLTEQSQDFLQKKLQTRVEIGAVRFRFPSSISLENFLLQDQNADTLARVGKLVIGLNMWNLWSQIIDIQQVTLENAAVYLHQKDSLRNNFDFIARAFAADSVAASPLDSTKSAWKLRLNQSNLNLQNVDFLLRDDAANSLTEAKIGAVKIGIAAVDLPKLKVEIASFSLADSDIRLISTKKSTNPKPTPTFDFLLNNAEIDRTRIVFSTFELQLDAFLDKTNFQKIEINSANSAIAIQAKGVQIARSALRFRDPKLPITPGHFNAGDLDLKNLEAQIADFSFKNEAIFVEVSQFSAQDKSGLDVHSLRATARVTPQKIDIINAVADLNHTKFEGDLELFKNEKATFDRLNIQIRRLKSLVDDVHILLPPPEIAAVLKLRDLPFEISGDLVGSLENLQTNHLKLRAGTATVVDLKGSFQNVAEPQKISMSLKINELATNRTDLMRFMSLGDLPSDSILRQPLPAFLATFGEVSGSLSSLKINLRGEVGPLQKGKIKPKIYPSFGEIFDPSALQLDVAGTLLNVNNPDILGMNLVIKKMDAPRSFFELFEKNDLQMPDVLRVNGTLVGDLKSLNTEINLRADRGGLSSRVQFLGLLKNLKSTDNLGFDVAFGGDLSRLEMLGYVADSVVTAALRLPDFVKIKGFAKGNMSDAAAKIGLVLGDFGQILIDGTLRDTQYQVNLVGQNLRANQLLVDTTFRPLKSVGMTAKISGAGFDFGQTARANLVGKLDSVVWENLILRDISLDANVAGRRFDGGFVVPDARVNVRARAAGDFSTAIPKLDFDVISNCLDLREFGWSSRPTTVCGHIIGHSEGASIDTLLAKIMLENLVLQYDTVHIRPGNVLLNLKLDNKKNQLRLDSDWLEGELKGYFSLPDLPETLANIAEQYFVKDRTAAMPKVGTDSLSAHFHLLKPDLLTTGLLPGLTELGLTHVELELAAARNYFNLLVATPRIVYQDWVVDSLDIRSFAGDSAAMFAVKTPLVKRGTADFIENAVLDGRFFANLANVSFKASNKMGESRFSMGAKAMIDNLTKTTTVNFANRQIIDFKEWTVNPENQLKIAKKGLEIRNFLMAGNGQSIKIDGTTRALINKKTALDFAVDIDRLNYQNFDVFVASFLSELGGWADAHLQITGNLDAPQVRGKMQLHETFFTPVATNVRYKLSETPLDFTETGISLNNLKLTDPFGKSLEINGKLLTTDWVSIQNNLTIRAQNWQVLNSTKQQNPLYFGKLFVTLDGKIRGSMTQPDLQISVKTAKESTFTYVYDVAAQVLQHEGIVYFLPPPRQNVRPPIYDAPVQKPFFTLSASVEIDSNLTINSVINPATGDDFRGKAVGKLQFDQLANGQMTLAGRVELVRGVYNYSYQSIVKRSFEVTTGSNIIWTGNPLLPELDLKARYKFKASPYPLIINQLASATAAETAMFRKSQTFFLQTNLSGAATLPDVKFEFIYPAAELQEGLAANFGAPQADLVQSALSNVNQDKNLLSRQVFGVLLLRNFIGESVGNIAGNAGGASLQTGLTNFLTGQINALADQYLTFIDVDLTTTERGPSDGASQSDGATNYQLRLQKSFFEDRLTFKLSGGTSVDVENQVQSGLENASVEYALNRKGEFKVTVFSEKGVELLNASTSNLRNSGAGFILSKEFGGKKKSK